MLDRLKKLYYFLPFEKLPFLKYIPDRLLYGKTYRASNVSCDIGLFQTNVYKMFEYVRKSTSFGKEFIPELYCKEEVLDLIRELPLISSSDLSNNLQFYISEDYSQMNSYMTTTGGTGRNPTSICLSNESFGIEWAHMHNIWATSNYEKKKHTKLTLRGTIIRGSKLAIYNPLYNELVVDPFKLTLENINNLLKIISKYHIDYIHGYPSLVKEFMDYCRTAKVFFQLKGVFLGSEGSSIEELKEIGEFFNCKVVTWYGQSEKVILAADTDMSGRFRVFSSYGYPYIYNPDETGFGEIIGTTFINRALPLINYRTGDYGRIEVTETGTFLRDIVGRWGKDFVYLNKNKRIPTTSINIHSKIQHEILFSQIYQNEFGKLVIKILPRKTTSLNKEEIIQQFKNDISSKLSEFEIVYQIVYDENEIVRSKRGKMIMLVQDLFLSK